MKQTVDREIEENFRIKLVAASYVLTMDCVFK